MTTSAHTTITDMEEALKFLADIHEGAAKDPEQLMGDVGILYLDDVDFLFTNDPDITKTSGDAVHTNYAAVLAERYIVKINLENNEWTLSRYVKEVPHG